MFYDEMVRFFSHPKQTLPYSSRIFSGAARIWMLPFSNVQGRVGYRFVSIGDLGDKQENKAIGKFSHEGIAIHPGDLGMARIACRILEKLKNS